MFEMFKLIFLDILGIRSAPYANEQSRVETVENNDDPARSISPPDYSCGVDRIGSFPVDRDRVL
jgi:hypothetical protein